MGSWGEEEDEGGTVPLASVGGRGGDGESYLMKVKEETLCRSSGGGFGRGADGAERSQEVEEMKKNILLEGEEDPLSCGS